MKLLALICLLFSFSSFAQSKEDINNMLDQMNKMGAFTPEQLAEAKKRLNNLSDKEVEAMAAQARKSAQDPMVQKRAQEIVDQMDSK